MYIWFSLQIKKKPKQKNSPKHKPTKQKDQNPIIHPDDEGVKTKGRESKAQVRERFNKTPAIAYFPLVIFEP